MDKPYKSYDELITFLKNEKNLIIRNSDYAKHILTKTSYFSLISGYKDTFKNPTTGQYKDGTTFEDIYRLYMFDFLNASVPIRVCKDFYNIGRKDMHSFLSILTKHRNVCAHGDRFFNYITKDSITDTVIHKKLHIPQKNKRYQYGKNDVFSEVIILKYLLDQDDFRNFYYELKRCLNKNCPDLILLKKMGFPPNWMSILRLKP